MEIQALRIKVLVELQTRRSADPYIYHHKWLFVDDDYRGFNVEESKARSQHWISLGDVDRSRIGRESYWNEQVIPRLSGTIPERWVRSDGFGATKRESD